MVMPWMGPSKLDEHAIDLQWHSGAVAAKAALVSETSI
jgi:hypothetical protein